MTNPNIDDLFKRGSERYEFSYRPDAWEQMEVLLDKQKQSRRRRLLLALLFLLVGVGLGAWLLWPKSTVEAVNPSPAIANEKINEANSSTSKQSNYNISGTETITENQVNTKEQVEQSKTRENIVALDRPSKNQEFSKENKPNDIINTSQVTSSTETETRNIGQAATTEIVAKAAKYSETNLPRLAFKPNWVKPALVLEPLNMEEEAPSVKEKLAKPPVTYALFTAVEWNSVGFLDETRRGWKVGANFEYPIGQKLSLGIGFAFNKKNYVAGEGEYKAKEGFWIEDVKPNSTKADCNVFEVPLNIQYYSNGTAESGWWTSVGLHSYFMNRETFEFNYLNPPTDAIMNWEERNAHRHFFGVSQFSFGYQKKISNRFIWQIAPYVQLPISRIGHGKVNLSSIGIQTNFKFTAK